MAEKINRNNDAKRDVGRSDLNRARPAASPGRVPEKTTFQKLLDQQQDQQQESSWSGTSSESRSSSQPSSSKTVSSNPVRPPQAQQERFGRDKEKFKEKVKEREVEREEGQSSDSPHEVKLTRGKEAEKRVISRESTSGQKGQGEGRESHSQGGHQPNSQGQKGGKALLPIVILKEEKSEMKRVLSTDMAEAPFALEMAKQALPTNPLKDPKAVQSMTKALLDQVVQYCRLITKTDGDKEMDMQLHEQIFKGLRIRVSLVKGKIEATLMARDREVQSLLQGQAAQMQQALREKGVEVKAINVTLVA